MNWMNISFPPCFQEFKKMNELWEYFVLPLYWDKTSYIIFQREILQCTRKETNFNRFN